MDEKKWTAVATRAGLSDRELLEGRHTGVFRLFAQCLLYLRESLGALSCVAEEDEHEEKHERRERVIRALGEQIDIQKTRVDMLRGQYRKVEAARRSTHAEMLSRVAKLGQRAAELERLMKVEQARTDPSQQHQDAADIATAEAATREYAEHPERFKRVVDRDAVIQELVEELSDDFAEIYCDGGYTWDLLGEAERQHVMGHPRFPHIYTGPDATCRLGDRVEVWDRGASCHRCGPYVGTRNGVHYIAHGLSRASGEHLRWLARGPETPSEVEG